jgi:hypothetical protein
MPPKQKTPTRCISTVSRNEEQNKIFGFMTRESKNVYNKFIFHMRIYSKYSNKIYKRLYKKVCDKQITNITDFDKEFYVCYDYFYKRFVYLQPFIKANHDIIYGLIKTKLHGIVLKNDNFYDILEDVFEIVKADGTIMFHPEYAKEVFYDVAQNILEAIYHHNFYKLRRQMLNKEPCFTDDANFLNQIKNGEYLLKKEREPSYKKNLKTHELFRKLPSGKSVKSDQNYIGRIMYIYHNDFKLPGDVMCNIIKKAYEGYKSYYAKWNKGLTANKPKFLDYDGHYILPFYATSRKEVEIAGIKYYRLTVGKHIANNYNDIVGNNKYICLNMHERTVNSKKYIDPKFLKPIPPGVKIPKSKNYIIGNSYVDKKSPNIIDTGYVFIEKPLKIENGLKLIEIVPQYEGTYFKINFSYKLVNTENVPTENTMVSVDLGKVNLMTVYDPNGRQVIIKGSHIENINTVKPGL